MGGGMDGMDDMNAPEPPMDADPMMGDQDMGGDPNQDPMGGPAGNEPDMNNDPMGGPTGDEPDMGNEPMDDGQPDMGGSQSEEDSELQNILDKMSIEDKTAVIKYAKSMIDDVDEPYGGMMPESRMSFRNAIDEAIDSVLTEKDRPRKEKKMPKKYRSLKNPFKTQY